MIDWSKVITADQKQREAEADKIAQVNAEALAYLASTDWYATRAFGGGKPVPADIEASRQAARDRIVSV